MHLRFATANENNQAKASDEFRTGAKRLLPTGHYFPELKAVASLCSELLASISIFGRVSGTLSSLIEFYRNQLSNPNSLDVHKLANSKLGEFAAVTGVLNSTKWQTRI